MASAPAFARFAEAPGNDRAALAACMRRPSTPLKPQQLAAVQLPVLLVLGDRDFAGPADQLVAALPEARLVSLVGADHFGTPKDFRFIDASVEVPSDLTGWPANLHRMGRGARSTVRWKHDRIRSKKARLARIRAAKAAARATPAA